jgi:hypothetical protein
MGAVKTNRREKTMERSDGWYSSFVEWERLDIGYKAYLRCIDGDNNRRKMAGLPLIRRAKS